jgi:hypothetical protein
VSCISKREGKLVARKEGRESCVVMHCVEEKEIEGKARLVQMSLRRKDSLRTIGRSRL